MIHLSACLADFVIGRLSNQLLWLARVLTTTGIEYKLLLWFFFTFTHLGHSEVRRDNNHHQLKAHYSNIMLLNSFINYLVNLIYLHATRKRLIRNSSISNRTKRRCEMVQLFFCEIIQHLCTTARLIIRRCVTKNSSRRKLTTLNHTERAKNAKYRGAYVLSHNLVEKNHPGWKTNARAN